MKKYDSYKDSGIEWIGDIPSHWDSSRYRYFYFSNMGVTLLKEDVKEDGIYPVYSATETDVLFGYVDEATIILNEGDIVIPARGNSIGHIKVVTSPSTSTQTTIYSKKISQNIETNFVKYFLQGLREHLFQFDRTAIPQITVNQVKNNPLVIPPPQEQTAIANFLDLKTSEIDVIIADKKRLLELYEEEKTAIINQAVTKGLDPNAPMKDSGIEWLGEIPEHWEAVKLKYIAKVQTGRTPKIQNSKTDYFENGTINWFTPSDMDGNQELVNSKRSIIIEAVENDEVELFSEYSIYLVSIGATLGKVGFSKEQASANQQINVITFFDKVFEPIFGYYYIVGNKEMITLQADYTTLPILNQSKTKDLLFSFPPIAEQESIVHHIESECSKIDFKKARTEELIELLTEYRTSLISEAVTGKIKVTENCENNKGASQYHQDH